MVVKRRCHRVSCIGRLIKSGKRVVAQRFYYGRKPYVFASVNVCDYYNTQAFAANRNFHSAGRGFNK